MIPPQNDHLSPDVMKTLEYETFEDKKITKSKIDDDETSFLKKISSQLTFHKEEDVETKKQKTDQFAVDTAITLLSISMMFVICQSVKLVPDIYELTVCNHFKIAKEGHDENCRNPLNIDVATSLGNLFCCINSAANFLLYMVRGKKFRDAFYGTYFACGNRNLHKSSIDDSKLYQKSTTMVRKKSVFVKNMQIEGDEFLFEQPERSYQS